VHRQSHFTILADLVRISTSIPDVSRDISHGDWQTLVLFPIRAGMSTDSPNSIKSVRWEGGPSGTLWLLDQTLLPGEVKAIPCRNVETVFEAIRSLRVRGAPAIGIAAAYGVCVGLQEKLRAGETPRQRVAAICERLAESRPTAVNLFWALRRMEQVAAALSEGDNVAFAERLLAEAQKIHDEDRQMCHAIGRVGAPLLRNCSGVLTHCNAGGLATSEYGTALAVIYETVSQGTKLRVYADETRPLLQGARLTAFELHAAEIPVTLICDSMAAQVMREGRVQAVVVGADRIAANGDAANKIGTYSVAILARHHGIPFYIAAPSSTFDLSLPDGSQIPIEERDPREITAPFGTPLAPVGIDVYNPAFDVTSASLITGIITERGLISPVNAENVRGVLAQSQ
jgi:methylthioribose-1-phosphate isomerase